VRIRRAIAVRCDSFNIPDGIIEYMDWMSAPDSDVGVWIAVRRG
jgi:hypothetical protein